MSSAALTADGAALPRPAINPWIIAMAVTLATFMEVLDTSIANVSLPHIAGSLSAGTDESTWVLTSYLVSNAIVLPLSGWISSIIGRKRFYMSCVAIFTVSSLLCGLAPNLGMLIFFRILQGAGGGGLQPSEQAILADTFPPAKRGMAFAVYGLAVVLAPAIGPTLGGWITDNFTWRWIFLLNIPVGILSLMLTSRLIQDPPYLKRKKLSETRIDYIGLGDPGKRPRLEGMPRANGVSELPTPDCQPRFLPTNGATAKRKSRNALSGARKVPEHRRATSKNKGQS